MSNPPSTGRLLDDDLPQPSRPRPTAVPSNPFGGQQPSEPERLASPQTAAPAPLPLQPAQRACYEALGLALQEGHVFAAVTGPEGSGKTTVLEAVLADRHDRALRCIRISDPDKVPARLAAQIEQVAYAEAGKPENLERHVVLAIDDAHTASSDLLRCLARLAAMREPGRRVPQVLLVGRPELWARLATEEYAPLARRLAVRAVLPKLQDEQDPWASLEQEVSQTMTQLRAESEHLPAAAREQMPAYDRAYGDLYPTTVEEAGLPFDPDTVPLPTDFALFPDAPARLEPRQRESKRRLLLPLGGLMVAVAAFTFMLSYFDWPGLFDDMPWTDGKPATPFAFTPPANQTAPWAQGTPHLAQSTLPRGAPPSPSAASMSASPTSGASAAAPVLSQAPLSPPSQTASPSQNASPSQTASPSQASTSQASTSQASTSQASTSQIASTSQSTPTSQAALSSLPSPSADLRPLAAEPTPGAPKFPLPASVAAAVSPPIELAKPIEPPKPAEAAINAQDPAPAPSVAVSTAAPEAVKPVLAPPPPDPSVTVAALAAPPLAATAPRSASRGSPIAVVKPAPLPPAIVGLLLRRGDEQLAIGDVSAARLLYERAAESGNAQAAFRLARTYDASFLPAADSSTLANRNEARVWYGRAASLGDREAAARLRDMNEGH